MFKSLKFNSSGNSVQHDWLCWGLTTCQSLWVILSSPRKREKRDRRNSRGDEREGWGRKRKMNESEETEYKNSPSTLTCCKDSRPCPTVSQSQLTPLPQPTIPNSPAWISLHLCYGFTEWIYFKEITMTWKYLKRLATKYNTCLKIFNIR